MDKIKLNFINRSNDTNNSSVVIFQKNTTGNADDAVIAWKVIKNCGPGFYHPFVYSADTGIGVNDSYGNYSLPVDANLGSAFEMTGSDGFMLSHTPATSPEKIEISNKLENGSINGNCYRDGKLLAVTSRIAPGETGTFEFKPTIWVGVVSEVEEGYVMNPAILNDINAEITLLGIAKANIIMTGGGPGKDPFSFYLEDISFA